MCAVPLVLERIYKSILDTMHRKGWAAEELFDYFMKYKIKWQDRGFDTPILNKTVFRVIRYFLGGRVRLILSGGAPLSPDTHSLTRFKLRHFLGSHFLLVLLGKGKTSSQFLNNYLLF
jgi:long-chain acyl-CoA synthetase